jgi:type II secretory pathway component GspD/PulD (secretin)
MTQTARQICWQILVSFSIGLMATSMTSETAFAQSLEVIELKHRTAQELIPALQPLLAQGGALSGQEYKLFVRTTNANLAEIRSVIAQLDRAPRQLLVSVRNATQQQIQRERVGISGSLSTQGTRARVGAEDTSAKRDAEGIASVTVLEGNAALINNGSSVPIVTAVAGGGGRRPWVAAQTEYRDLTNGFVVTPRVSGDQVILEISQRAESLRNGTIETQQLQTQAAGRVGEWLSLGGVNTSSSSTQRGIGTRQYSTQSDQRSVWIKVELQ